MVAVLLAPRSWTLYLSLNGRRIGTDRHRMNLQGPQGGVTGLRVVTVLKGLLDLCIVRAVDPIWQKCIVVSIAVCARLLFVGVCVCVCVIFHRSFCFDSHAVHPISVVGTCVYLEERNSIISRSPQLFLRLTNEIRHEVCGRKDVALCSCSYNYRRRATRGGAEWDKQTTKQQ